MRRLAPLLVSAVAVALAGGALAAPGDPQKRHNPADQRWAQSIPLRRADVGPGWSAQRSTGGDSSRGCPAFNPDESDLVETGDGNGLEFARRGAFIGSGATVYVSEGDARASWSRVVRPGLLRCMSTLLEQSASNGTVTTRIQSKGALSFPRLAQRTAAYRLRFVASTQGVRLTGRVDLVLLGEGRADAMLMLMSFDRPFPPLTPSYERRLAASLAQRLHR